MNFSLEKMNGRYNRWELSRMVVGFSWSLNLWVLGIVFPEAQVAKRSSLSFAFIYCQGLESMGITLCSKCAHVPLL